MIFIQAEQEAVPQKPLEQGLKGIIEKGMADKGFRQLLEVLLREKQTLDSNVAEGLKKRKRKEQRKTQDEGLTAKNEEFSVVLGKVLSKYGMETSAEGLEQVSKLMLLLTEKVKKEIEIEEEFAARAQEIQDVTGISSGAINDFERQIKAIARYPKKTYIERDKDAGREARKPGLLDELIETRKEEMALENNSKKSED